MNSPHTSHSHRGFTLIELLVVIGILLILASLIVPITQKAIRKGRLLDALNNGQNIYRSLMIANLDGQAVFPVSGGNTAYDNSTDFWKWMVENEIIDVDFSRFSAHGLPVYHGLDPAEFMANNNAWCITADITDATRDVTPVIFSRNLDIASLGDPLDDALTDVPPFGESGVVVVRKGGDAAVLMAGDLETAFNPAEAENPVLRP